MTEGYAPRTVDIDDARATPLAFKDAPEDDVLRAMEFGMVYQNDKPQSRPAGETRKTVAQMIYNHLMLSGYVILKKPPRPPFHTHGLKKYPTE